VLGSPIPGDEVPTLAPAALAIRREWTVDTDYGGYYETIDGERLWREDRIEALLATDPEQASVLFVQGTSGTKPGSIPASTTSCCSARRCPPP
jgi:hypothetical protein